MVIILDWMETAADRQFDSMIETNDVKFCLILQADIKSREHIREKWKSNE